MPSYNDLQINYQGCELDICSEKLTSLADCPEHITGQFNCRYNELRTLAGGPQKVDGDYKCYSNQLTDLIGCASHIGDTLICWNNQITSLVGIHKIIKRCSSIEFDANKITEGGIGLLLIENLIWISSNSSPFAIIEKYIGNGTKGMMACRAELISKGWADNAKL